MSWDGVREIIIQLNSTWKGKVCGMCGNYNGKTKDEFTKRGGGITYTVNSFGNSWGYGSNEKTCVLEEDTEDACASNPSRHTWAKFACSMINTDVFKQCNDMVSRSQYRSSYQTSRPMSVTDCVVSFCYTSGVALSLYHCSPTGHRWKPTEVHRQLYHRLVCLYSRK